MSIFRSIALAGMFCSMAAYAQYEFELTDPAYIDNFDNEWLNQNEIGAVYGQIAFEAPWDGGGYWYTFTGGGSVKNGLGEEIVAEENEATMIDEDAMAMHVVMTSDTTVQDYPFAGVGCSMIGNGVDPVDLSKITAIKMKVKGSGSVRFHLETQDIADSGWDWGWYGYILDDDLGADWKEVTITTADLEPELYSEPAKKKWKWSHGAGAVTKIAFQTKNGNEVDFWVDDIQLVGMTWGDFNFPVSAVKMVKSAKNTNMFSVNASNVSFNLPKAQNVTVALFDAMGNQVRTLFSGTAASKSINLSSMNIPSGRYMAKLSGKGVSATQSLVIMK